MPLYHLIILAIIQGITEFLPISSSGHLVLMPHLMAESDQGLLIDVAVHIGTLLAVMLYFARDIQNLTHGVIDGICLKKTQKSQQIFWIVIATFPIIIVGYCLHQYWPTGIRSVEVIAWTTLLFGLLLGFADRFETKPITVESLGWRNALIIGCAQILALIPGTSRSGVTMTAGRFLNLSRVEASRFSFLISIPTIAGAGLLAGLDLYQTDSFSLTFDAITAGFLAFITALLSIHFLLKWIERYSFKPFVIYRVILGIGLLAWLYL